MRLSFSIAAWAAWAPGVVTREAWQAWAISPALPVGADAPALLDVPPMARRRIDRLGRMALHVTSECLGATRGVPLLFASRHGDAARTVELLTTLAREEALSPTSFSLSVHNAAAGQYSIVRSDTANITALSAGKTTLEAALVEAVALLHDGHAQVGLTAYDVALPSLYGAFVDEPQADFAFSWLVTKGDALHLEQKPSEAHAATLPHALDVLRFVLSPDARLHAEGWEWSK